MNISASLPTGTIFPAPTRDIDIAALNNSLIERGMQLGNGYGDLKNKTFRIAHMGELTMDDMRSITSSIVDILKLK